MKPAYPAVSYRAGHRCEYCHAPERVFNVAFEVEHVQPLAAGGTDELENLALSCRACNQFKSDARAGWDATTQTETALFHPRQQAWEEHFAPDVTTGEIRGMSPCGRATIARLQMNRPQAVAARRLWQELGLYP